MRNNPTPTKEQFDDLLTWLGSDADKAATKYESIRHSLVKFFTWQGYWDAEDLADKTIDRVTSKVSHVMAGYSGDPALYFYGVARKLLLEHRRNEPRSESSVLESNLSNDPERLEDRDEIDRKFECLDKCMEGLSSENRTLIIDYYQHDKRAKIDFRREIAKGLGMEVDNLRVKMFRIRSSLFKCIEKCLSDSKLVQ